MHLPENIWNSPAIRERLFAEASIEAGCGRPQRDHYWFIVPEADTRRGCIELKNWKPSASEPPPTLAQQTMAAEIKRWLQKEISHGGFWIVGWTHPPIKSSVIMLDHDTSDLWRRMVFMWLDEDCDPQFPIEFERDFYSLMADGPDYFIDFAEKAYQAYNDEYGLKAMKSDLGLKEVDMTKASLSSLKHL